MFVHFDVFICYRRDSGEDFAEHLKMGLERFHMHTFLDTKDIPQKFKGTEEWTKIRNNAVVNSRFFLLIVTPGFDSSPEIKKELSLARKQAGKEFVYFRHKDLRPNLQIVLDNEELDLGKQQQIPFDTKQDLLRKAHNVLIDHQKPPPASLPILWEPLPVISSKVTQTLIDTFKFPQVGWELYNNSPYQLKVRIEIHPFLGGKDLHPLFDDDINGTNEYLAEPNRPLWGNGCFTLPAECARSKKELILEIRATVVDVNDPQKGEYVLLPKRWKYIRETNSWSYHPQIPRKWNALTSTFDVSGK